MRGRPLKGYRRTPIVIEIENEFDQPYLDVVRGFAEDGHNKNQTAAILGIPNKTFYHQLKSLRRLGIEFNWPNGNATRYQPHYPRTEKQKMANLENLKNATGPKFKLDDADAAKIVELRTEGLTWESIAYRMGVDQATLVRARRRFGIVDPLQNRLQKRGHRNFGGSAK